MVTQSQMCEVCQKVQGKHEDQELSWPEVMNYGIHLALEHTVKMNDDGTVLVNPKRAVRKAHAEDPDV